MASVPLLTRISGLNSTLAANIVAHRDANGAFKSRRELLKVSRLGEKTFEQAAGFLRIGNGDNPLDASSVHPEAYPVVEKIVAKTGRPVKQIMGGLGLYQGAACGRLHRRAFRLADGDGYSEELDKPGRDPRPEFKTATSRMVSRTSKTCSPA